ncbi:DUF654-domain-containing protein [Patellaria atrata CBS 101060]|uniref:DUF654-domain-containing protein n=1 Tax=Patellaria atrata CBS 101060 TaxID=1346257 RepID=A0A9P4SDC9_9PEZI|nr:DUF654-domain-containing protein [Patellaria atrata CBS 101060]
MSSRALRKAQRELEEQRKLQELQAQEEESEEEGSTMPQKKSLFAMLKDAEEDKEDHEPDEEEEDTPVPETQHIKSTSAKRKKKKSKKVKVPEPVQAQQPKAGTSKKDESKEDEIDRALKALSLTNMGVTPKTFSSDAFDPIAEELYKLICIDRQSLHASNEMRRLFGRAAMEEDAPAPAARRQQGRRAQNIGTGRNQPGLRISRANIFMQPKDTWPPGTGGGLGMDVVEKESDGVVEYRFVHSTLYQDTQRQFQTCVASMDPERLLGLEHFNPYHISTLLQVSEIVKHRGQHADSGDRLERALFSFGRAVHSTFPNKLAEGKARLDFNRPENREFWLASWMYIENLSRRATWRTVYEWAKLLLSLDPDRDPYRVHLVIDQYALRARQPQHFIELAESAFFKPKWENIPNIQYTLGLAYVQTGKAREGRTLLISAIEKNPWTTARLFQELNIDPIPPSVWGSQPRTPYEKLITELYVLRAKDIWNTPEATSLLMEVAHAAKPSSETHADGDYPIKKPLARHAILTNERSIIALLPREITSQLSSSSDPLPPDDNLPSYSPTVPRDSSSQSAMNLNQVLGEVRTLQAFFHSILPWYDASEINQPVVDPATGAQPTVEDVERRIRESGIPAHRIVENTERLRELQRWMVQHAVETEVAFEEDSEREVADEEIEELLDHLDTDEVAGIGGIGPNGERNPRVEDGEDD